MRKYLKVSGIVTVVLAVVIICCISGYFLFFRKPLSSASGETKNLNKEELLAYDKFFEGIYINGIDLKDLTKEEAIKKVKDSINIGDDIILSFNDYTKKIALKDINFSYNYEDVINEAFNIGRQGTDDERINTLKELLKNPRKFELKTTFDATKLNEIIKEISEKLNSDPVDEKFGFASEKISVIDGKTGIKVDEDKILDIFKNVPSSSNIEIPIISSDYKRIDKNLLSSIKGVIGESTTKFDNQPNRNTNIKISADKVNEYVVNPGETFSFSKVIGEVTKSAGYKPAGTFLNNKIVDSIGGGICQVTSTLYQALVKADLKIVERNQHSMRVPYCTIGLDAMFYEGQSDLKFQNTFDFPVVITSYVSNGELTFKILGDTDKKNYNIKLFTTDVSTIRMPVEEIPDPTLPEGKKVVVEKGFPGYRGSSYKQKDGESPVLLNSDYYQPKKQIVKVGTKKATTEEPAKNEKDKDKEKDKGNKND